MDDGVGFGVDDIVDSSQEVVVDLLLAKVHAGVGIEAGEGCQAEVGVGDVDEVHFFNCLWGVMGYRGVGEEVKMSSAKKSDL